MSKFDLLKIGSKKDPITGKVSFTESIQFKISMGVVVTAFMSIYTLDILDFDIPGWLDFFMAMGIVIGYFFAFTALFFSRNAGTVRIKENVIKIDPKNRNKGDYPDSPIIIDKNTSIHINIIQSTTFILSRTLLHIEIEDGDSTKELGIILRNKKKHQQYLDVLESWYRNGYKIKEFDQLGNRTFKLNKGKNYAEVQKIKQEYGIEWQ
ncbi:MAG: hypothetical protein RI564_04140 [Gracilimonas sp.]|nr:hypothetical protein [Gracilimonas sp.]